MVMQNSVATVSNPSREQNLASCMRSNMESSNEATEARVYREVGGQQHQEQEQERTKSSGCDKGAEAAANQTNSDNENSTNSTWSNSQSSRAAMRRLEASHKLNLILPQTHKGCLSTPVIVTSDQVSSGNQLLANCSANPFTQNASSQLFFDSLGHLNGQGEVSLFTGLPSCTPASADRLSASSINPFFWGTTSNTNHHHHHHHPQHPMIQNCDQPNSNQNEALSLQSRQSSGPADQANEAKEAPVLSEHPQQPATNYTSNQASLDHRQQQQYQSQQQQQHQQQQYQHQQHQHRTKLTIANLQASRQLSPLILSPLSLLGFSPEQEAWLRFGYVSPGQHPLAGKSFTQADLNQMNHGQHQFNMYAQPMANMHNQYHQQEHQQRQNKTDTSIQQGAQDLTSASSNQSTTLAASDLTRSASQQSLGQSAPTGQQQIYQQQQQHQQQQQAYTRNNCIQYENISHNNSNIIQQQQQQQQQQQHFLQPRGPQAQQYPLAKSLLPSFQISTANQNHQLASREPTNDSGQFATQHKATNSRDLNPAQSQLIYHPGPTEYISSNSHPALAPVFYHRDTNLAPAESQSQPSERQESLIIKTTPSQLPAPISIQQQQQKAIFISANNEMQHNVASIGSERSASANLLQPTGLPPVLSQQGNSEPAAKEMGATTTMPLQGQQMLNIGQACSPQKELIILRENLRDEVGSLRVSEGDVSPSSSDNDTSRTHSQIHKRAGSLSSSSTSSNVSERTTSMGSANPSDCSKNELHPSDIDSSLNARKINRMASDRSASMKSNKLKVKQKKLPSSQATKLKSLGNYPDATMTTSTTTGTSATVIGNSNNNVSTMTTQVALIRNENGEPVKKKSRGGRKKKLVTHEEMIARKNRSKERNRVAARRCRQKRKQFLDELRDKIDGLNNMNQKLQKENLALKGELEIFKRHHSACSL